MARERKVEQRPHAARELGPKPGPGARTLPSLDVVSDGSDPGGFGIALASSEKRRELRDRADERIGHGRDSWPTP
jgi:hypothetical protein